MMMEEASSPKEESSSQIIEGVLGGLELERPELFFVPLEAEDEETTTVEAADKVPQDKGLEVRAQATDEVEGDGGSPGGRSRRNKY